MREYILSQIARRQQAVGDLDKQIQVIERQRLEIAGELRAYEDMLGHVSDSGMRRSSERRKSNGAAQVRSSKWRTILEHIAAQWPNAVTTADMAAYAERVGSTISRQAIRAQTSNYSRRGSLERIDTGVYRITPKGAAELGISLKDPTEKGAAASGYQEDTADSTWRDTE
jgi:hypothetical protein